MAEFDAAEAAMAQEAQTRPVDRVRAEEEELLESNKPVRPARDRSHEYPASNRLATGGVQKVGYPLSLADACSQSCLPKSSLREWQK